MLFIGFSDVQQRQGLLLPKGYRIEHLGVAELTPSHLVEEVILVNAPAARHFMKKVDSLMSSPSRAILWYEEETTVQLRDDEEHFFTESLHETSFADRWLLLALLACQRSLHPEIEEEVDLLSPLAFPVEREAAHQACLPPFPFSADLRSHAETCPACWIVSHFLLRERSKKSWGIICPHLEELAEWAITCQCQLQLEAHASGCPSCQAVSAQILTVLFRADVLSLATCQGKMAAIGCRFDP